MDRLLLSLIFHSSRDREHAQALQDVANALSRMSDIYFDTWLFTRRDCVPHSVLNDKAFELPRIPATACLTVRSALRSRSAY